MSKDMSIQVTRLPFDMVMIRDLKESFAEHLEEYIWGIDLILCDKAEDSHLNVYGSKSCYSYPIILKEQASPKAYNYELMFPDVALAINSSLWQPERLKAELEAFIGASIKSLRLSLDYNDSYKGEKDYVSRWLFSYGMDNSRYMAALDKEGFIEEITKTKL